LGFVAGERNLPVSQRETESLFSRWSDGLATRPKCDLVNTNSLLSSLASVPSYDFPISKGASLAYRGIAQGRLSLSQQITTKSCPKTPAFGLRGLRNWTERRNTETHDLKNGPGGHIWDRKSPVFSTRGRGNGVVVDQAPWQQPLQEIADDYPRISYFVDPILTKWPSSRSRSRRCPETPAAVRITAGLPSFPGLVSLR
jgi:hypothetical protein